MSTASPTACPSCFGRRRAPSHSTGGVTCLEPGRRHPGRVLRTAGRHARLKTRRAMATLDLLRLAMTPRSWREQRGRELRRAAARDAAIRAGRRPAAVDSLLSAPPVRPSRAGASRLPRLATSSRRWACSALDDVDRPDSRASPRRSACAPAAHVKTNPARDRDGRPRAVGQCPCSPRGSPRTHPRVLRRRPGVPVPARIRSSGYLRDEICPKSRLLAAALAWYAGAHALAGASGSDCTAASTTCSLRGGLSVGQRVLPAPMAHPGQGRCASTLSVACRGADRAAMCWSRKCPARRRRSPGSKRPSDTGLIRPRTEPLGCSCAEAPSARAAAASAASIAAPTSSTSSEIASGTPLPRVGEPFFEQSWRG